MADPRDEVVCFYCGRKGYRGFRILSGDHFDDPGRVTWICEAIKACKKRQVASAKQRWFVLHNVRTGWGSVHEWEGPFYSRKEAKDARTASGDKSAVIAKAVKETEG